MFVFLPRVGVLLTICVAVGGLDGCTSSQAGSLPTTTSPNIAASSTLQFAVGTATIGIAGGGSALGLNTVTTFRQSNGNNATGVNTPSLSGPPGVNFGPLLGGSNTISGTTPSQLAAIAAQTGPRPTGTAPPSVTNMADGFGPFVGAFGYGLAADNLVSNTDVTNLAPLSTYFPQLGRTCFGAGQIYSGAYYGSSPNLGSITNGSSIVGAKLPADNVRSAELGLPLPSGTSSGGNCQCASSCAPLSSEFNDPAFPQQFFGGPPAWPSPQGYGNFSYFVGYPLGFTDFTATPVVGTYTMSVAVPTNATDTAYGSVTASAKLSSLAALPVFPQPALQINADGSGTVTVNVPAGVTEAVISVATFDCDLTGRDFGASLIDHYALITRSVGRQTLFLSSNLGPPSTVTGLPTHTFCTVGDYQSYNAYALANSLPQLGTGGSTSTVNAVGFDYPAYEASYPFNTSAAPTIVNARGQADITTSYPLQVMNSFTVPIGS